MNTTMQCKCGKIGPLHVRYRFQGFELLCLDCYSNLCPPGDFIATENDWEKNLGSPLTMTVCLDWFASRGLQVLYKTGEA